LKLIARVESSLNINTLPDFKKEQLKQNAAKSISLHSVLLFLLFKRFCLQFLCFNPLIAKLPFKALHFLGVVP
jgi:hypothetical protein